MFVPSVSVAEVADEAYLLDVREPHEWVAGHAPDAVHVPMMEIPARWPELPDDRDVVVVCRVGERSAHVVAYLLALGHERAVNLDGGMAAWQAAGRPVVTPDGGTGHVL